MKSLPDPRKELRRRDRVVFQVEGYRMLVSRPGNPVSVVSYFFPTPTVIRGIIKSVYHSNKIFPVPTKVEILKPLKTTTDSTLKYRDSALPISMDVGTGGRERDNQQMRLGSTYIQDVAYRFHVDLHAIDDKKIRKLKRRLEGGGCDNFPYLGTRECGVEIVPLDDREPDSTFNCIEPHFVVGSRMTVARAINGVVEFPDWTYDAMVEFRDERFAAQGDGA